MNVVGLREDKIYCLIKISLFEEWLKWGGFLPSKKFMQYPRLISIRKIKYLHVFIGWFSEPNPERSVAT